MKNKKVLGLFFSFLSLFCLGGCWDQTIFEENVVVLGAGISSDSNSQNNREYKYTFILEGAAGKKVKLDILSIETDILSDAIAKASRVSPAPLQAAKLQTILIEKSVAERGFTDLITDHKMEEVNRFAPDYAIAECNPIEIYEAINKLDLGASGFSYLENLMRTGGEGGFCPNIYSRNYDIDFLKESPDPILPMINLEKNRPVISGTALFKDKKYIGKFNSKDSAFLQLVLQKTTAFTYALDYPKNEKPGTITFNGDRSSSKTSIKIKGDKVHIYIDQTIAGFFDKVIWNKLIDEFGYEAMENYVKAFFEKGVIQSMVKLQALGVDPLGIKGQLKGYHSDFAKTHDLDEAYANAEVTVNADIYIKNNEIPQ